MSVNCFLKFGKGLFKTLEKILQTNSWKISKKGFVITYDFFLPPYIKELNYFLKILTIAYM